MEAQTDAIRATDVTAESRHSSPDIAPPRNGKKPSRVDLPGFTYAELITMAIQSSPSRMMTIVDIQQFFRDRFPCFRTSYKGWHNSIRHNLSARECFYKVPIVDKRHKCRTHYWMINPSCSHCRDGNGLLQEARQWRTRRMMAKNVIRKKRRGSKKNGSSTTTRNADGLDSKMTEKKGSWKDAQLPCQPFPARTPPMHPMEYTQLSSPDQFTHGPRSPAHQGSDWTYPTTYLTHHQPACQECGDDMTGDCEYCVLLEVDDEPPSPIRYSSSLSSPPDCLSTRSESVETGLQTLSHYKPSVKEESRIQELALKDDPVLDDIVDKQDLFQTDDNFDASVYNVGGHIEAHQHSGTVVPISLSKSLPPSLPSSPAPSSPMQYAVDLSRQSSCRASGYAVSPTLPDCPRYQAHPNLPCTSLPPFNYYKGLQPYFFFQDQAYHFDQCDRLVIDPRCHVADTTKGFYRYPSEDFVSDCHRSSEVAGAVDLSVHHQSEFIGRTDDERRSIPHRSHCDNNCNDSLLLIEPMPYRTIPRVPTNSPVHRFPRPVDSSPIPFHHGIPSRHTSDNAAPRQSARLLGQSRFIPRSNVNVLLDFGGEGASPAFVAAPNDIRTISSLGELLKVSMVIASQHEYHSM
ncbi:uncharacterized protein LOC115920611 isoform X1 [Strongylocentrotus purpuratus]|uniref:Fork-head domain-containing protein n=2 Tax=Strongylocentrotus purpuratus TaxID=7668 RepID=A0A7M7N897_STRPU|nr:uncharacterized protein LOC115920611 isoform X1 [Strongylocentrotus purpuratus]